jgi:hypothetical protein
MHQQTEVRPFEEMKKKGRNQTSPTTILCEANAST